MSAIPTPKILKTICQQRSSGFFVQIGALPSPNNLNIDVRAGALYWCPVLPGCSVLTHGGWMAPQQPAVMGAQHSTAHHRTTAPQPTASFQCQSGGGRAQASIRYPHLYILMVTYSINTFSCARNNYYLYIVFSSMNETRYF